MDVVMSEAMPTGDVQMTQMTILPMASLKTLMRVTMGVASGPIDDRAAPINSDTVMI